MKFPKDQQKQTYTRNNKNCPPDTLIEKALKSRLQHGRLELWAMRVVQRGKGFLFSNVVWWKQANCCKNGVDFPNTFLVDTFGRMNVVRHCENHLKTTSAKNTFKMTRCGDQHFLTSAAPPPAARRLKISANFKITHLAPTCRVKILIC